MAISPDGRYLSSGSCKGGVMTWDIEASGNRDGEVDATRLSLGMGGVAWPDGKEREVSAVDWGKDLVSRLNPFEMGADHRSSRRVPMTWRQGSTGRTGRQRGIYFESETRLGRNGLV